MKDENPSDFLTFSFSKEIDFRAQIKRMSQSETPSINLPVTDTNTVSNYTNSCISITTAIINIRNEYSYFTHPKNGQMIKHHNTKANVIQLICIIIFCHDKQSQDDFYEKKNEGKTKKCEEKMNERLHIVGDSLTIK